MPDDFLDDIGATTTDEAFLFSATTQTYYDNVNGSGDSRPGSRNIADDSGNSRGLGNVDKTRNYFRTTIEADAYNTERFSLVSGANAVQFGLGGAAQEAVGSGLDDETLFRHGQRVAADSLAALDTVGKSQETSLQDFEDNLRQLQTMQDAARMLALMSGRQHRVITAVAVSDGVRHEQALQVSEVEFARLSAAQIARYVASREPFGKAGAYAIQSQAAAWIVNISGSYSGIMGLPLFETATLLAKFGFEP